MNEHGPRFERLADYKSDWWHGAAKALNAIEQLRKRCKGTAMLKNAAKTRSTLALEGPLPLGKATSATARLRRNIWEEWLLDIEKQETAVNEGMKEQVEKQARQALEEGPAKGRRARAKWSAGAAKENLGIVRRIAKDAKRCEQEVVKDID